MTKPYGINLKLYIEGGSHDEYISAVLHGFPKGFAVDTERLYAFMQRRSPGRDRFSTPRYERDIPRFISGVTDNITNGEAVEIRIYNENVIRSDYNFNDTPRPGHADYTAVMKYGIGTDISGGGHFSGRLTAPLCAAGGMCLQYLEAMGIRIFSHIYSIGGIYDTPFDPVKVGKAEYEILDGKPFGTLSDKAGEEMKRVIDTARRELDSVGGIVECAVTGLPAGLGEHMFASCEGRISSAVFAIPAVKAVEFGTGFGAALARGSENNDPYVIKDGAVTMKSNNSGGILGGMSTSMPLIFRAAVKPTPSIGIRQSTVSLSKMENTFITVGGRHDPCIVPRSLPAFEAAAALAVLDMILDGENI